MIYSVVEGGGGAEGAIVPSPSPIGYEYTLDKTEFRISALNKFEGQEVLRSVVCFHFEYEFVFGIWLTHSIPTRSLLFQVGKRREQTL